MFRGWRKPRTLITTGVAAAFAVGLTVTPAAHVVQVRAAESFIPTTDRGAYIGPSEGTHEPSNENYRVGGGNSGGVNRVGRAFFYFAIPAQSEQLLKVDLQLFNPAAGYNSSDASETLTIYDVATAADTVRAGGSGKTAVWDDLGSGPTYGSKSVTTNDNGKLVTIPLNAAFLAKVQAGGNLMIGAAISSLDSSAATIESLFNATTNASAAQLRLTTAELQPDGRIRKGTSGSFLGNDVYNSDGTGQTATGSAKPGKTVIFNLSVQNDSNKADKIAVLGGGTIGRYQVKYFKGSTDITYQVSSGMTTYRTKLLAPGESVLITMKVKVLSGATVGSQLTTQVTLRSDANFSHLDVIKATAKRA